MLRITVGLLIIAPSVTSKASLLRTGAPDVSLAAGGDVQGRCTFDHSRFDKVLRQFVTLPLSFQVDTAHDVRSTLFDYSGLLASSDSLAMMRHYVASLSSFKPSCLTHNGKLAFWANTYNALIVNLVLSDTQSSGGKLPGSIKDLHGNATTVWQRQAGIVNGKAMSLEDVLTEGRSLGDPRIHAAVNCASLSCPDLRSSAYNSGDVQAQFDTQVQQWLANPTKGAKMVDGKLLVSHIFEWHKEDFPSVSSFLAGPLGVSSSSIEVSGYLPYNWELNAVAKPA